MIATVVDLRYRMKDVLKALERNEEVKILYHGKLKGIIQPVQRPSKLKIRDHVFYNMSDDKGTVDGEMKELRGGRYHDL